MTTLPDQRIDPSFFFSRYDTISRVARSLLTGSDSFSSLPPDSDFKVAQHVSMARMERYVNGRPVYLRRCVSSFNLVCILLRPNMVSEQEEGEKEGSQEKRMDVQSQHFLIWTLFELVLQEEG